MSDNVIAIDGPAGVGKSSAARRVANKLQMPLLNTGMIYRAVGYLATKFGIGLNNPVDLTTLIANSVIRVTGPTSIEVNGNDVSEAIQNPEVGDYASVIAQHPAVRTALLSIQRAALLRSANGLVTEGRDTATVVFPNAELKVFLTAEQEIRRQRLLTYHRERGKTPDEASLAVQSLMERDQRDASRDIAPLIKAPDAVEIDSTFLTEGDVARTIYKLWDSGRRPNIIDAQSRFSPIVWRHSDGKPLLIDYFGRQARIAGHSVSNTQPL